MSEKVALPWSESLIGYDFGPGHPLAPIRVDLTIRLSRALGLFSLDEILPIDVVPAAEAQLKTVHTIDYIDAVRAAGDVLQPDPVHGLGTPDDPVFPGMHEASALVAGASLAAARAVWERQAEHAVNVAGGLHHAMPSAASGFCIYNDPALAIRWLLDNGARRVAYVDVDVHHGDGVQAVFYDDPRVLTISLHEDGRYLFPGTGFVTETGAEHTAVNVPLPPGTDDGGWLRAFHAVVPPLVHAFDPEVLVSQHGCDTHRLDPLAHLALSVDGQRQAHAALHSLAHAASGGRWVAFGGGGYELVQVVPRSWTHLLFEAAGAPLDPATPTPQSWQAEVRELTGESAPLAMGDGEEAGYQAWPAGAHRVDQVISQVRAAVFPPHGLRAEAAG